MTAIATFKAWDTKPSEQLEGDIEELTFPTESDLFDSESSEEEKPDPFILQISTF